jgi:predicted DNA-binding transcriptional regulator AlpA
MNTLIDARSLQSRVLFSTANLLLLERRGLFPARVLVGQRRIAWPLADVIAWMQHKVDTRPDFPPAKPVIVDAAERFIGKPELTTLVPYSHQNIRLLELKGQFPPRIRIGENRSAWLQSEVRQWIEDRLAASRNAAN